MTATEKELSAQLLTIWERDHRKSDGARCVRRLIGKQCLLGLRECNCDPPLADHVSMWWKGDKLRMVIQPYGELDEKDLMELFDFCSVHGLKFSVSSGSWHYPGWTTLIVFESQ